MKKSEMINYLNENIHINAYRATICEKLSEIGFDTFMMDYHKNVQFGKAFAFIEMLGYITDQHDENTYGEAVNEALNDMASANYDVVKMLDMAGFDGKEYYESYKNK